MKTTDTELIRRAQSGDRAAFDKLVQRYDRRVLSVAASYTSDHDESQDIYQEVFLRVYRSIGRFEFRSEFSTWLFRITTNVCLTHQMRAKRRAFVSIERDMETETQQAELISINRARAISPEQSARNAEIRQHVGLAMENLSPQQRLVFTLKHYEGYKLREIADHMECSEGTVKKYLFTANGKMRKQLSKVR